MADLFQGRIVIPKIRLTDPQGHQTHSHRFIVLSSEEVIADPARPIFLVAISHGRLTPGSKDVELQYGPACSTGLRDPSFAIGQWTESLPRSQLEVTKYHVRPEYVERIILKIAPELDD